MNGLSRWLLVTILVLTAASSVACGVGTPAAPAPGTAVQPTAASVATAAPAPTAIAEVKQTGAKVVRVLAVAGPETDALIKHAAEFEKETGITASIEQVARPLWGERKVRELIEDSGIYDVVMVGGGDDLLWVKTKAHWLPLDDYLSKEDKAQIIDADYFVQDGKLMGVPQYYNFPLLFYRMDLLEDPKEQAAFKAKYGRDLTVPKTYDELKEVAEFFTRPPDLYGFFLGGTDWSVFLDHTYFTYGMGTNYGDLRTGELTLNSPEQKRAMTALTRMTAYCPPGWETMTFFDGDQLMQSGKIFMYQNWLYIWQTFNKNAPDKIGMALPAGDVQPGVHLGAFVAVIPKAAANPDSAGKFIRWMLSAAYQKAQTLETGNLPVRQEALTDPEVRQALVGIDTLEKALTSMNYQHTTWTNEVSAGVSEAIWKVFKGEMTPDEACDWLQEVKFKGRKAIE